MMEWDYISQLQHQPDWHKDATARAAVKAAYAELGLTGVRFGGRCSSCYIDAYTLVMLEGRKLGVIADVAPPANGYDLPRGGIVVGGIHITKTTPAAAIDSLLGRFPMLRYSVKKR